MISMSTVNDRASAIRHARRVHGQVGALATMITAGRPIADLAQQVVAARASLDALLLRLIELELTAPPSAHVSRTEIDQLLRIALGQRGRRGLAPPSPGRALR